MRILCALRLARARTSVPGCRRTPVLLLPRAQQTGAHKRGLAAGVAAVRGTPNRSRATATKEDDMFIAVDSCCVCGRGRAFIHVCVCVCLRVGGMVVGWRTANRFCPPLSAGAAHINMRQCEVVDNQFFVGEQECRYRRHFDSCAV